MVFFGKKIRFVAAFDLNKCLTQIKKPRSLQLPVHISVLPFQEKRGKHFLDDKKDKEAKILAEKERRKRERSPTPESMELKQLKRMKEIQDLVVKEEEKYVAEPLDPAQFMWDDK